MIAAVRHGLLAALLLGQWACTVQMAYNNADRFVRWSVDDYLDLERHQRDYLEVELARIHQWHRRTQLPRYRTLIDEFALRLAGGQIDGVYLTALAAQVRGFGESVEAAFLPAATQILVSLTPEQRAALPDRLERANREFEEDERDQSADAIADDWRRTMTRLFRRVAGRPTPDQQVYLAEAARRYQPERVLWTDYRRRWQAALLALLDERPPAPRFDRAFRQLVADRPLYYGEAFAAVSRNNEALAIETLSGLFSRLTPEQAGRAADYLAGLAEDLDDLVARGRSATPGAQTLAAPTCLALHIACGFMP